VIFAPNSIQPYPFAYKREKEDPRRRGGTHRHSCTLARHFATRDFGSPFLLSTICNPYCKPVQEHEQSKLDARTFRLNQYKPLCPFCTHQSQMRKHKFSSQRFEIPTVGAPGRGLLHVSSIPLGCGWPTTLEDGPLMCSCILGA
jgi:hypothetical protein